MNQINKSTDTILNKILDKIITNGIKSLSDKDLIILNKISKGEPLSEITLFIEKVSELTPLEKFNNAINQSGYQKDFKKIYGPNYTTKGRVTGWFIEKDFIAYIEFNDKRTDSIFDNIADKLSVDEFNDMITNIITHIETEFKLKFTNDVDIIKNYSIKYKLNNKFVAFVLHK